MNLKNYAYNRSCVKSKILHFGVGNFHRAHLEAYVNHLLNLDFCCDWGVCGAMIMPQDGALYNKLKSQENIYSLTICGRDGKNSIEWIGSLVELYWSEEDLEKIINKVADPNISIISLTITEGGYSLDGDFVKHDFKSPKSPKSVFGIVAEGLRKRIATGGGALTILSCDNLQHNGDACKKIFSTFFMEQDPVVAKWVEENVTFPNSMVDRITPATTDVDVLRINEMLDKKDLAPVYCEDFLQWVVEDNFIAGRPEFEKVGVEFTDNVAPYEKMKLSLLNASHTLLSYPSFLCGYRKVDLAMKDEKIIKFVEDFMNIDVTPYVPAPKNTDLGQYKKILVERFANSSVSDQISRLCGDGASKFQVYIVPIVKEMLKNGDDMKRIAYLFAAYYHYLKYKKDDNGDAFDIFEPCLCDDDYNKICSDKNENFLLISAFVELELIKYPEFVELYSFMVNEIMAKGAKTVLEGIV